MKVASLFTAVLVLLYAYSYGCSRAKSFATEGGQKLHSRPRYHGYYLALWSIVPVLLLLLMWVSAEPIMFRSAVESAIAKDIQGLEAQEVNVLYAEIQNLAKGAFGLSSNNPVVLRGVDAYTEVQRWSAWWLGGASLFVLLFGFVFARAQLSVRFRARHQVERAMYLFMVLCSTIAVLTTIGIVCSLIFESIRFFQSVPISEFLFGAKWSPQMAIRADQVGSSGAFGAIPLFVGTGLIACIAMCVAAPIGLMSAIYLAEYASKRVRALAKPVLEILAGIPTVVYGFFAALTVAPWVRDVGTFLGLSVSSESALAAGSVMGVMIIPYVSSLSDDVINAVPQTLRDGSYALGATKSETIKRVIFPAALPGIIGALLLAISRAVGETMIVVMAAGLGANLTVNPLSNVTTVTVQIVTILVGDQEFDSPKTLAAFALGLVLFVVTLILNVIALQTVKRYREKYD